MSNFLAIATVSEALRQIIATAVGTDVSGTLVTIGRPPEKPTGVDNEEAKVNIYLFQVTPNAALRNADLPTYSNDGSALRQRPQTALDLHYMLSFYGVQTQLVSERLMGSVVRTLHGHPVLTQTDITNAINANSVLDGSDLADQIEKVKFTPNPLSLEELSKMWTVFQQVDYTTSLVYQASVILIESEATPLTPLPVETRNLYVLPTGQPLIERVVAQSAGETLDVIDASVTLLIQGRQLRGDVTKVRIGTAVYEPTSVSNTQIEVDLMDENDQVNADLRAGVQPLQVIHELLLGGSPHTGTESNVTPLIIHPIITAESSTTDVGTRVVTVTLNIKPVVGKDQRAVLLLNVVGDSASSTFVSTQRVDDTNTLVFDVGDFPTGTYNVRLQIDGAISHVVPTVVIT